MSTRTYTLAEKQEALELAETIGAAKAGEQLGIPSGSIYSWRKRTTAAAVTVLDARGDSPGALPEVTGDPPPTSVSTMTWEERRRALVPRLGAMVDRLLDAAESAADSGKARDARDLLVGVGICVDKASLLSGSATSRVESASVTVHARSTEELMAERDRLRKELGTGG